MAGNTFTTYINAKRSGSVDAEFAAIEAAADKSLSGIQRKAEAAGRSLAGLTGGRGGGGIRSPLSPEFSTSLDSAAMKAQRLAEAETRLERENSALVRGLRTTGQTLQVVQGPLGPIAGRVSAAADAFVRLSGVTLGLAGAGAALFAYARAANTFVEVRSKLAPLYDSQTQVNQALSDVYGIALRSRAALEPIVALYARMKLASDEAGVSQQELGRLTELTAKSATLSGGTQQSQQAGLYQFSQAFASNTLQGQDLRSLKEDVPFLARELAKGIAKLPEFSKMHLSGTIGDLKKLGEQGLITTDVMRRALESMDQDIEGRFAKLPVTVGQAFTNLQTNATKFVGNLEDSTHIVNTVASGVLLIGNNLNQIVGVLGGVAAGWLAVAAAAKAGDVKNQVSQWAANLRAQQASSRAALESATLQRNMIVQRAEAFAQEAAAIEKNIALLETEIVTQRRLSEEGRTMTAAGMSAGGRMTSEGEERAYQATLQLAQARQQLTTVSGRATQMSGKVAAAEEAAGAASANAAAKSSLLKMGGLALLDMFNPLGLAVGFATTAFLEWAMSESEAEKNAKAVETAQRNLAEAIDLTTGKVIAQNAALLANAKLNAEGGYNAAAAGLNSTRTAIADLRAGVRGPAGLAGGVGSASALGAAPGSPMTRSQQDFVTAIDKFTSGGSAASLTNAMQAIAKADPSLKGLTDQVTQLAATAVDQAHQVQQFRSAQNILTNKGTDEDRRRVAGDFSGGAGPERTKNDRDLIAESDALAVKLRDKRYAAEVQLHESLDALDKKRHAANSTMTDDDYVRERAQIENTYHSALDSIDKQDQARADKDRREEERRERAHQAELKRIEEENQRRQQRTETRSNILGNWTDEPKAVVKAQRDMQTLNDLVGKTMNGLVAITKDNPLGQGIYTAQMAADDAQRIQDGLQRPYEKYMEQRQRDLNVSKLILNGRDLEAQALQKAYELYDQIGTVTMDQYESILANLRVEQRINDALAERERLLAPLQEGVGQLRDSIASALEQFEAGGNPLKAGQNLLKSVFAQFNKITATQLAERLTGGLDERVRDLMNGSVQVDSKIAEYISALGNQQSAGETLATALNSAATAADNAATALNGIQASGGAGGALGAASVSSMGPAAAALLSAIPSSFYKPGTKVGGGIGDDVLYKALGQFGAVITDNLRPQSTQNRLFSAGLTTARTSDHTTSQDAWDVRLPAGMSFAKATALVRQTAAEMGASVVKALDETISGGTGRHAHYVIAGASHGAAATSIDTVAAATGASSSMIAGMPAPIVTQAIKSVSDVAQSFGKASGGSGYLGLDGGNWTDNGGGSSPIVVTGRRTNETPMAQVPTGEQYYNKIGQAFGQKLDKTFGTHFLGDLGSKLGTAMGGAQTGAMVAGVGKMLWSKFSTTGSEIGGAVGKLTGIPGGDIVGSILGGVIGGLFKKTQKASDTVSATDGEITVGKATGNGAAMKQAVTGVASTLGDALTQIADSLNGTLGNFSETISTKTVKHGGFLGIGAKSKTVYVVGGQQFDTEEEAFKAALSDALSQGAVQGISAASRRILSSGKDLQTAINKAIAIEGIPKALKALKDPVGAAVDDLNTQFTKLISYLKEGGATADQYRQAQELYDLERQQAIDQAQKAATSTIQDMLDSMLNSQQSPLNKKTVYDNAKATLAGFVTDINSGKTVDDQAFTKAVSDMQDASRALNGSNSTFFSDFDYLVNLLQTEKSNLTAGSTPTGSLPGSPFDDPKIQALINGTQGTTDAINTQTQVVGGLLGRILDGITARGGVAGGYMPSAIDLLPSGSAYRSLSA